MLRKCDLIWLAGVISSILISQFGCLEPLKKIWKGSLPVSLALAFALGLSGWVFAGNTSDVYQSGDYNEAYTEQIGDGNTASCGQRGDFNGSDCSACNRYFFFDTSGLTQYQYGYSNLAEISIVGSFNNTCQRQEGNNNHARIEIDGDSNTTKQVQLNDYNFAEIIIDNNGHDNIACQYQDGGQSSTIIIHGMSDVSVYRYGNASYPP